MPDIREMIGKDVEVIANGMAYKGKLIEVSESEVYLKTTLQSIALPASSVTEIRLAEKRFSGGLGATFPVDDAVDEDEDVHDLVDIEEIEEIDT